MKTNSNNQRTFIIPAEYSNERLDQCLAKLLPEYSRTQIQAWIEAGLILIDDHIVKPKTKVKGGEHVLTHITPRIMPAWEAQALPLTIVYEDEALIIINKPVGMIVHPGAGHSDQTLLNALLHHAPTLKLLPRAGILHRLDKNTSGLLVIAKTAAALKHLLHQLKERTLLREYQAIVTGRLISGGKVDAPIGRHALQRIRMAVTETGKPACTHYRVMERYRAHTRLTLRLETGRTHQIRVHMAHIHHPIVGDTTYGGRLQLTKGMSSDLITCLRQFKHQALHAFRLGLVHPVTEKWLQWEIELPEDMQQLIHFLKEDV